MQKEKLKISEIIVGKQRKRALSEKHVETLKLSIQELGLLNPLVVNSDYELIAGYHRFQALKDLAFEEVDVQIVDYNELKKELAEIDENLVRNELTALDFSEQLLERKKIYEKLHPEATEKAKKTQNLPNRQDDGLGKVDSFTKVMAEILPMSDRTIQRVVKIGSDIPKELKEKIKGKPLENNRDFLYKLAKMKDNPKEQEKMLNCKLSRKKYTPPSKGNNVDEKRITEKSKGGDKKEEKNKIEGKAYLINFKQKLVYIEDSWCQLEQEYDMKNHTYNEMVEHIKKRNEGQGKEIKENNEIKEQVKNNDVKTKEEVA